MRITFIGDPRQSKDFDACNPGSMLMCGVLFPLGEIVTVDDEFAKEHGERFENHSHFRVGNKKRGDKAKAPEAEVEAVEVTEPATEMTEDTGN